MTQYKYLRALIIATAIVAISCAALAPLFLQFLQINSPQYILSLSTEGLSSWYIWQPLSYIFVLPSGMWGLSFNFFLELAISLYILWLLGNSLAERVSEPSTLKFYFTCAILSGLIALAFSSLVGSRLVISGPSAALLALLTAWTMIYADSELMFFFVLSMKAKWLLLLAAGLILLQDISTFQWGFAAFHIAGILTGYIYATTAWQLASPYAILAPIDRLLIASGEHVKRWFHSKSKPVAVTRSKVVDFYSGKEIISDDQFMDQMLEKISRSGEKALSWGERRRMRQISEKRSRRK